jgi:glycosyltransferase involved in cell wall biosynthesis
VRTVITVANLRPEKDHRSLLAAAENLARKHPGLRFQIVGDGPLRADLERDAASRGLGGRVAFLGHRDDVPALLAAADLYVLPSCTEAFPNGVLEAMTAGLPVVACAVEGLLDLVTDGETGALVPASDPVALAASIERFVDDPALASRVGAAARAQATRYSFEAMVARFEALYLTGAGGAVVVPADRSPVPRTTQSPVGLHPPGPS